MANLDGDIWVVDNDSVDGSVEMVREKFPDVHLIANKENTGFSVANNQAIIQSKGEYVFASQPRYRCSRRHIYTLHRVSRST